MSDTSKFIITLNLEFELLTLCEKQKSSFYQTIFFMNHPNAIEQRCTTFLGEGRQGIIFSAVEGQRQNYDLIFESRVK